MCEIEIATTLDTIQILSLNKTQSNHCNCFLWHKDAKTCLNLWSTFYNERKSNKANGRPPKCENAIKWTYIGTSKCYTLLHNFFYFLTKTLSIGGKFAAHRQAKWPETFLPIRTLDKFPTWTATIREIWGGCRWGLMRTLRCVCIYDFIGLY